MSGTLRLRGSTSGYAELQAAAVAGDQTFILPAAGGTLLTTDSPIGNLTLELGSASAPSLRFEGDTDTGLFSSGANTLNLVTGGSNKLVLGATAHTIFSGTNGSVRALDIDSNGHIGIGQSNPDGTLHVHTGTAGAVTPNSGADDIVVENNGDCGISLLTADGNNTTAIMFGCPTQTVGAAIRYNNSTHEMSLGPDDPDSSTNLRINSGDGVAAMYIDSSKRVLIGGHSSGNYQLEVAGSGVQTLLVGSTNAGSAMLVLDGDSNGDGSGSDYASILHGTDANLEINNRKNADILFKTGSSETTRLIIKNSGNVGIGSTNPLADLTISNGGASGIELEAEWQTNTNRITNFNRSASAYNKFRLDALEHLVATSGTEVLSIDTSRYVRLSSNSPGLQFNGDTAAANALDDYEEGFWNPTVNSGSNPSSTLTVNRARYIKNGTQCTIWCELVFAGGDGGNFRLQSVPYNAVSTGTGGGQPGAGMSSVGSVLFNNLNITGVTSIKAYIFANIIYFYYTPGTDGGNWNEIHGDEVGGNTNGGNLIFALSYYVG